MKYFHTSLSLTVALFSTSLLCSPHAYAGGIAADPNLDDQGYRHMGDTEEYKKPNRLVERKQRMHEAAMRQAEILEEQKNIVILDIAEARLQKRKKERQFMYKSKNTTVDLEKCSQSRIGARSGYCRQRLEYVTDRGRERDEYLEKNAPKVPGFTLEKSKLTSGGFRSPRNSERKMQLMIDEGIIEAPTEPVATQQPEEVHMAPPEILPTPKEIEIMKHNTSRIENPKFNVGEFTGVGFGGSKRGQTFEFGAYGSLYDFDTFITVKGEDSNGKEIGTAAQLSKNQSAKNIRIRMSATRIDTQNFQLEYTVTNTDIDTKEGSLFVFLDPEILNDHSNSEENGTIRTDEYVLQHGSTGGGARDDIVDSFETDEPRYAFGDIVDNMRMGKLENANVFAPDDTEDVSVAVGFDLQLQPGRSKKVRVLLSSNGTTLGQFSLEHHDSTAEDILTISGMTTE